MGHLILTIEYFTNSNHLPITDVISLIQHALKNCTEQNTESLDNYLDEGPCNCVDIYLYK